MTLSRAPRRRIRQPGHLLMYGALVGLVVVIGCVDVSRETIYSADCKGQKLAIAVETRESISVTLYDFLLLIDEAEADRMGGELGRKSLPVKPEALAAIPQRATRAPPDDALIWQVYLNPARYDRAAFDALSACLVEDAAALTRAADVHPLAQRALGAQMSDRRRLAIGAVLFADYARLSERYCHAENPTLCVHVAPGGEVALEEQTRDRFTATFLGRTPDGRILQLEGMGEDWLARGANPALFQDAAGRSLQEVYRIK